jgi:hypothetical protein
MKIITGRVVGNTVVLDEPMPDGTWVEVSAVRSPAIEYALEQKATLSAHEEHEVLAVIDDIKINGTVPAEEVFAKARSRIRK